MFAAPSPDSNLPVNPLPSFPLLDPKSLNFEEGLKVVNRTTRFVIPVPAFADGGELMLFPPGTEKAGEMIKQRDDGTPERGFVFFNGKDRAWQAARGNGMEAILINDVSREQAAAINLKYTELGGPQGITLDGIRSLLNFARDELGIVDFYDKKMSGVNAEMAVIDPAMPLYMVVTKPTVHSAVYVREPFTFDGPVPQIYPEGAVVLNSGKYSWGIDAGVFQRNFKVISDAGERSLGPLDLEFGKKPQ